jgi:hypothetical protein
MRFSRRAAIGIGVLAPLLDTVRRWSTWREWPPALLDDYAIGALLLWAAWVAGRDEARGRLWLAAAWGFACAFGWASFFGQLWNIRAGVADPAPVPSECVAVIKGIGFAVCIAALAATLRRRRTAS